MIHFNGCDPTNADTDFDGRNDYQEVRVWPYTSPSNPDTDGDQLSDGQEVIGWDVPVISIDSNGNTQISTLHAVSNPRSAADTDGDGLNDYQEFSNALMPNMIDTDGDHINDGVEVANAPVNSYVYMASFKDCVAPELIVETPELVNGKVLEINLGIFGRYYITLGKEFVMTFRTKDAAGMVFSGKNSRKRLDRKNYNPIKDVVFTDLCCCSFLRAGRVKRPSGCAV
jgi:hypothetical protein